MTRRLRTHLGTACVVALGLVALFGLPALDEIYLLINSTIYASFALLALSLGLIWGFGGILCFGQAAFFGLGGYAYAAAAINFGDTNWAVPIGILVPACFALLLGYFMFWKRISDVYLGVITLTVSLILYRFFNQTAGDEWKIGAARLGGFNGIPGTPPLNWPDDPQAVMWPEEIFMVAVGALIVTYLLCKLMLSTRFGRTVVAVRENETRARLLGYDVRLYKLAVFAISGGIAGLAGILFANTGFVSPNMFSLQLNAQVIIWVIVGGLGTLVGPIIGCILIQILTTELGTVNQTGGLDWLDPNLVLGVVLVVFVLLIPRGLVPTAAGWATRASALLHHRTARQEAPRTAGEKPVAPPRIRSEARRPAQASTDDTGLGEPGLAGARPGVTQ